MGQMKMRKIEARVYPEKLARLFALLQKIKI